MSEEELRKEIRDLRLNNCKACWERRDVKPESGNHCARTCPVGAQISADFNDLAEMGCYS